MIKKLTPETDAFAIKFKSVCGSKAWVPTDICRRFERERDEARKALKHIEEYGTEEINAAVELRQKLASALVERDEARTQVENQKVRIGEFFDALEKLTSERDEARERCSKLEKTMSYSSGATTLLSKFLKVLNERNDLIQKLDAWEEIAEHLHHLVQHPAYGVDQAIRRMDVLEAYKHLKHGH